MKDKYIFINQYDEFKSHVIDQLLKDNNVQFKLENTYEQSLNAGWMNPGSSHNAKDLFVKKEDVQKTNKLLSNLNFK